MKLVQPPPDHEVVRDEAMKRYLLGQASVEERDHMEERFFSDPSLAEELAAVETELIDAWVRGALPAEERALVENVLLASPAQRERLRNARALLEHQRARTPQHRWLAIAASIAVMSGLAWWLVPELSDDPVTTPHRVEQKPPPEIKPPDLQRPPVQQEIVATLVFAAGVTRSEGDAPRLDVPKDARKIRLVMELLPGDDAYSSYTARLQTMSGAVLSEQTGLTVSAGRVALEADAAALAAGRYELLLEAGGDLIGQYIFDLHL